MKWLADENIDASIVERLRRMGHTVWYVCELNPGISDDEILKVAREEAAIVLMADKGFGDLVFRLGQANAGVVLLRVAGLSTEEKANLVESVVSARLSEIEGAFTVIARGRVRVRRRAPPNG